MNRTPVTSSQLDSVGFDAKSNVLEIAFKNYKGGAPSVYQYTGVAPADYANLMAADSKGKHFGAHIKGRFPYKKVS